MADFQQALPNNYPDLNTLFDRMPGFAAQQAGAQSQIAQQNNEALQNAFAAQEQYNTQKRPFDLSQLQAQTEHQNALTRGLNLDSDLKAGTNQSTIDSTNSTNKTKIGANDIAQME